jgi:hypothetical protein
VGLPLIHLLLLLLSCGAASTPDAGTVGWACEYPRCCARRVMDNACVDFGCCEDDGWRVAP